MLVISIVWCICHQQWVFASRNHPIDFGRANFSKEPGEGKPYPTIY